MAHPLLVSHNGGMTRKLRNTGRAIDVSGRMEALKKALYEVPGLIAVYLYGSYGTSYQTPLSDVDIAVLCTDDQDLSLDYKLQLIGLCTETLQEEDVSVTILNQAPLAFRYKVLAEGRPVFIRDRIAHAGFLERTINRYPDFAIDEARFFEEYDRALVEDYCDGTR